MILIYIVVILIPLVVVARANRGESRRAIVKRLSDGRAMSRDFRMWVDAQNGEIGPGDYLTRFDASLVAKNWGEILPISYEKLKASITLVYDEPGPFIDSIWRGSYRVQNEARWFTADGRYSMARRGDWFLWRAIGEPERGRDMVFVDTFRTFEELDAYVRGEIDR